MQVLLFIYFYRPLTKEEGNLSSVQCDDFRNQVIVSYKRGRDSQALKTYKFDKVFSETSTQEEVFNECIQSILDEVLSGYNCTVFAYGQTGTGKTYTMEGNLDNKEENGVIPRSIQYIFERLYEMDCEYSVNIS